MNRNTNLGLNRIVCIVLIIALFTSLVACGSDKTSENIAANQATEEVDGTENQAEAEAAAAKPESKEEPADKTDKADSDAADSKNNEVQSNALDEFKVYGKFAEFTTNDINGNEVTQSIFASLNHSLNQSVSITICVQNSMSSFSESHSDILLRIQFDHSRLP